MSRYLDDRRMSSQYLNGEPSSNEVVEKYASPLPVTKYSPVS
jgi:hypothetical protein